LAGQAVLVHLLQRARIDRRRKTHLFGANKSRCREKLDDVPALLLVRDALRHARATHRGGGLARKL
jgi:hypothetical protein